MNKLFLVVALVAMCQLNSFAQECGEIFNDQFSSDGALPGEWVEYNTSGRVTVSNGRMVFNYNASKPSAQRSFTGIGGEFYFSFDIESSRNWNDARMRLTSSSGNLLAALVFGNSGSKNIMYATGLDASNNPKNYVGFLDGSFSTKTIYQISMVVNTGQRTIDFYMNGELKASGIAFLQSATDFARIDIQQISLYGGSGYFYVDNVKVLQDTIFRGELDISIRNAQTQLAEVTVGTGAGEYSQGSVDQLEAVITAVTAVLENCSASQADVDNAVSVLSEQVLEFNDSRIWGSENITVNINPNNVLCDKNPIWFGGNNTYNGSGQGLWDAVNKRCHYNVIDLSNYTGASGYRFPGGTMANLYKWKQAIGPVNERIDNLNSHGAAGPLSNEFGPDEFGQMLEKTHLKNGVIVVAFNWDSPDDAADYVEYMNAEVGDNPNGGVDWAQVRADNGHPEPYGVKYWEIGNELSGDWELSITNYPSSGDDNRGGDNIIKGLVDIYVNGGYRSFTKQRASKMTSWEKASCVVNGTANQEFYTKFPPVDLSSDFTLKINNVEWERVPDFSGSSSSDLHYTVDAESGKIKFGNGVHGMKPAGGYNVMLDYRSGEHAGFPDYYEAMKAVDPSIDVISCWEGSDFYEEMAKISKPFDGVTKHYYPSGSANEGDEYKMVMKKAVAYKSKIAAHLNYLSKYSNASLSGKNVKQHLTEFFGGRNIDAVTQLCIMWYDVINSYPDKVGNIMAHSYFKNDNSPMVNTGGNFVAAKGLPFHIFTHLHQDKFVEASYQGGSYTYNSTTIKNSFPTASINDEGNILTLVVPNTRDNTKLNATFNVANYGFAGKKVVGKKWIARADDIYAVNSSASPFEVSVAGPYDIELSETVHDIIQPYSVAIYQWIQEDADYLSDLSEEISGGQIRKDKGFTLNESMKVNGITYNKGISVSGGSSVTYLLNKKYSSFKACIGLDDEYTGGRVNVKVYVDDVLMSTADMSSNTPSPEISVDVTDANSLRLETSVNIPGSEGDYIIFGNARLVVNETANNTAKNKLGFAALNVFPNPFTDQFTFDVPDSESCQVQLNDMAGKTVYTESFEGSSQLVCDHVNVNKGVYVMTVFQANRVYVTKLTKK